MYILDFEKPLIEIQQKIKELEALVETHPELKEEIERLKKKAEKLRAKIYKNLTRWQMVQLARHPDRPHAIDYIQRICKDFVELHGDRLFRDDPSIIAGIGKIDDKSVVIIGEEKGRKTQERIKRNFGMPHPEGYRKADRVMKLGEKFKLPVITLVDTPGAYPGIGAEERGQALAIAESILFMLNLKTPIISIIIGEGGSGGALAIAVGDVVLAMEFSIYSVISPEGCASILWRDAAKAPQAADALKLTAKDLYELGIVEEIIPEPPGGAHTNSDKASQILKEYILKWINILEKKDIDTLLEDRRKRYLKFGKWRE